MHDNKKVERVGEALRQECLKIFGSTWSNDNAWRLARAAIAAMDEPLYYRSITGDRDIPLK